MKNSNSHTHSKIGVFVKDLIPWPMWAWVRWVKLNDPFIIVYGSRLSTETCFAVMCSFLWRLS